MAIEDDYVSFNELPVIGFHINSVVAIIGLLISLFMFGHTLYEYKIKKGKNPKLKKKNTPSNQIIYSSLSVFFLSIFLFTVYCIEFFFLRMFPPGPKYPYDPFKFCKRFSPFLFISAFLLAFCVIHYFLIRLEGSFKGSVLEYPKLLYIISRIIAFLFITIPIIFVVLATDGLPYNAEKEMITDDNPWLCRNGIRTGWPNFWYAINAVGLIVVLGSNFLNWYLFMNRLSKLIKLGIEHDESFISYYTKKRKSRRKNHNRKRTESLEISTIANYAQVAPNVAVAEMTPIDEAHTAQFDDPEIPDFDDIERSPDAGEPRDRSGSTQRVQSTSESTRGQSNSITSALDTFKAKIQQEEEERLARKKRRTKKEIVLYELIKRQSVLTGIVCISGAALWTLQLTIDEGSTMTLISMITNILCVYLSFSFKIRCFEICCGKCMDDCTCIEDRIEKRIAKEMGLKQLSIREDDVDLHEDTNGAGLR